MNPAPIPPNRSSANTSLAILTLPFLLNDFANIFVRDYRIWLAIDYVFVKALPLVIVFRLLRRGVLTLSDLGLRRISLTRFLVWTLAMAISGIIIDQVGSRFFARLLPDTRLGSMPQITSPLLDKMDLYLGLALVGLVEEMIFRGLYFTVLSTVLKSKAVVLLVSALAFGLIHWSLGISAIAHTALVGVTFMICIWRTGSVLPTIVAHFIVNYVAFAGILP